MKAIFAVLVEKLKEVEAQWVSLGIGIFGLFTLWACTSVIRGLFQMITRIVELVAGGGSDLPM